ncbi:MAG: sulfatase-like hydrolase/transferase [Planctomycetes bacterium]|nr:sulfatase-like hydrolase/transferase [Planctomycetota bacterium]
MTPNRPNILFITTDQQNPNALGLLDSRFRTPHLDRLAGEGVVFTRSYSCCPLCTPARATWVTGQYPFTHGAWSVGTNLDKDCLSLPRLLGEAGYRTAIIGKSHLEAGGQEGNTEGAPLRCDTDHFRRWAGPWYGFEHAEINIGHVDEPHSASMHYRAWLEGQGVEIDRHFRQPGEAGIGPCAWSLPEEYHPCKWVADRSIEYLHRHRSQHADRPFYLNMNFPEPHRPFKVPQPWFDRFQELDVGRPKRRWNEWEDKPTAYRAFIEGTVHQLGWHAQVPMASMADPGRFVKPELADRFADEEAGRIRVYAAMVALMDHHIGRVLAALDELGIADNTLVLFTSDHGDYLGEHFIWSKGPCHYDGCLRVPMIARWPGASPSGQRTDALVSNVDIAPTFLDAAGLSVHPQMQGVSQGGVFRNPATAARRGALIDHRAEEGLYVNSWITDRYRLSIHHTADRGNEFELYDLAEDPDEFVNLAADGRNPELVAELMADMLADRCRVERDWQPRPCFA